MKATIVTTIAQHTRGVDIHLRNLEWATKKIDAEIIVQTFKSYNFKPPSSRYRLIEVDADTSNFYYFYDEIDKSLFYESDVVFLTQQDMFYTEPIEYQLQECNEGKIITNLRSFYLSIFDRNGVLLYPRLWEGGCWYPKDFIHKTRECGFGFTPKFLIPGNYLYERSKDILKSHFSTCMKWENAKPLTELLSRNRIDIGFELTVYAFLTSFPQKCYGTLDNFHCDYGKSVSHLRGIESLCRDQPNIYNNMSEIDKMMHTVAYKKWCNGCALALYLCGIHDLQTVQSYLMYPDNLELVQVQIEKLLERGEEWMTDDEIDRLRKALRLFYVILM